MQLRSRKVLHLKIIVNIKENLKSENVNLENKISKNRKSVNENFEQQENLEKWDNNQEK